MEHDTAVYFFYYHNISVKKISFARFQNMDELLIISINVCKSI